MRATAANHALSVSFPVLVQTADLSTSITGPFHLNCFVDNGSMLSPINYHPVTYQQLQKKIFSSDCRRISSHMLKPEGVSMPQPQCCFSAVHHLLLSRLV